MQLTVSVKEVNQFIESLRELIRVSDTQVEAQQTQTITTLETMITSGQYNNVWPLILQIVSVAQRAHEEQQHKTEAAFNELIKEVMEIEREMVRSLHDTTHALSDNSQQYDRQLDDYMGGLAQEINEAKSLETLKARAVNQLSNMRKSIKERRTREQAIIEKNQQEIEKLGNELANARQTMNNLEKERTIIQQAALTCPLTGVANKRAMDRLLHQAIIDENYWPFSLAVMDVDHFKTFNDNFGHQAGDKVLTTISQQVTSQLRPQDQFFRYAGDEFVIFFGNTEAPEALQIAEKIRASIEAVRFRYKDEVMKVTTSIGLAQVSGGDTAASIFERADLALLEAKRQQRNCVMTY